MSPLLWYASRAIVSRRRPCAILSVLLAAAAAAAADDDDDATAADDDAKAALAPGWAPAFPSSPRIMSFSMFFCWGVICPLTRRSETERSREDSDDEEEATEGSRSRVLSPVVVRKEDD